ncbi:MAG: hypothetical protein ABL907_20915 [Hyphomicrobium sp.]
MAGTVSLNQGGGFKKISTSAPAAAGDVVLTGPQGVAYIVYENGCREKVDSSQSATVSDPSVCKEVGLSADGSQMAVGALAVGGIIAGAVIIGTSGDDDRAASP